MAKALQRRRGTTAEHANFTGLEGEFTYDTTEKRIVAHDGVTKGGIPMATKKEVEEVANSLDPRILDAASQSDILEAVSQATVGNVDAPTLEGLQAQIAANASNITSIPVPVRYVVETWSSGTSWYTKYNDGWIEQGGVYDHGSMSSDVSGVVITFQKAFSNTNYTLTALAYRNDDNKTYRNIYATIYQRTATNFKGGWVTNNAQYLSWYACGY